MPRLAKRARARQARAPCRTHRGSRSRAPRCRRERPRT